MQEWLSFNKDTVKKSLKKEAQSPWVHHMCLTNAPYVTTVICHPEISRRFWSKSKGETQGPFHHHVNIQKCRIHILCHLPECRSPCLLSVTRGDVGPKDKDPTYLSGMFSRAAKGSQKTITLKIEAKTTPTCTTLCKWSLNNYS